MVYPLFMLGFAIAGARAGLREKEQKLQSQNQSNDSTHYIYENNSAPNNVIVSGVETPEPQQVQSVQSSNQQGFRVVVGPKYRDKVQSALMIINECDAWNLLEEYTAGIEHDPNDENCRRTGSEAYSVRDGEPGRRYPIRLCSRFFNGSEVDCAFVILHELYHCILWIQGEPYGGAKEESECDNFARQTLAQGGYSSTYQSNTQGSAQKAGRYVGA